MSEFTKTSIAPNAMRAHQRRGTPCGPLPTGGGTGAVKTEGVGARLYAPATRIVGPWRLLAVEVEREASIIGPPGVPRRAVVTLTVPWADFSEAAILDALNAMNARAKAKAETA